MPGPQAASDQGWAPLLDRARAARRLAYAPYSRFPVGVAARVDDGRLLSACNVENACYGLGLCAECGLVSSLVATGGGRLVDFVCVGPDDALLTPCGRCRQLLYEFGGPRLQLLTTNGPRPLAELLPDAFGPWELERAHD